MTRNHFDARIGRAFRATIAAAALSLALSAGVPPVFAGAADTSANPGNAPDAGIRLAACKPPLLPTEGCVKNPCDGKYICCTSTSGMTKCRTMDPPKPKK